MLEGLAVVTVLLGDQSLEVAGPGVRGVEPEFIEELAGAVDVVVEDHRFAEQVADRRHRLAVLLPSLLENGERLDVMPHLE